jgi:hypothetical protein
VHVVPQIEVVSAADVIAILRQDREAPARKLGALAAQCSGLSVTGCLVSGQPADEIVRIARKENADVIVMAATRRSWVGKLLLGNIAEPVTRRAPCPVLTVTSHSVEASVLATPSGSAGGGDADETRVPLVRQHRSRRSGRRRDRFAPDTPAE